MKRYKEEDGTLRKKTIYFFEYTYLVNCDGIRDDAMCGPLGKRSGVSLIDLCHLKLCDSNQRHSTNLTHSITPTVTVIIFELLDLVDLKNRVGSEYDFAQIAKIDFLTQFFLGCKIHTRKIQCTRVISKI